MSPLLFLWLSSESHSVPADGGGRVVLASRPFPDCCITVFDKCLPLVCAVG